ncbi:hypothetical protein F966_01306 [Acinetobacter higginsii]|uniref:Uncharacterized protein n=1 Tax=Acinetobacter higginsii TaxID=70347 RepID=N8XM72_9GAMM|nr:hypothetical protein F966_01306 [Acinetobacter higginsii]
MLFSFLYQVVPKEELVGILLNILIQHRRH